MQFAQSAAEQQNAKTCGSVELLQPQHYILGIHRYVLKNHGHVFGSRWGLISWCRRVCMQSTSTSCAQCRIVAVILKYLVAD